MDIWTSYEAGKVSVQFDTIEERQLVREHSPAATSIQYWQNITEHIGRVLHLPRPPEEFPVVTDMRLKTLSKLLTNLEASHPDRHLSGDLATRRLEHTIGDYLLARTIKSRRYY
jgi:hypothetical protein